MSQANLRILLCTYYWPPSGGAGVQRSLKFAKYLSYFNVEPTVLTSDTETANYPVLDKSLELEIPENIKVIRTPSKEPFGIYRKVSGKKEIPQSGFANENKTAWKEKLMRFVRGNFFLPDARKGWNPSAIKAASELIEQKQVDLIFTSSPPHSSQLIGLALKEKYGIPWIADLRDPWTDIYYYKQLYPSFFAQKKDASYERRVLEKADKIIVVSESLKKLFLSKSEKIDPKKVIVIPNGYDPEDFQDVSFPKNEIFTLSYTGTIAQTYDLKTFAKACKACFTNKNRKAKIRFVGSNSNWIQSVFEEENSTHLLELIPSVEHKKSVEYLQSSDALLLLIPQSTHNKGILTGKIFEYLGSNKPIIGIGPTTGDAAEILRRCEAGEMFDYGHFEAINTYLESIYQKWEKDTLAVSNKKNIEEFSRKAQSKLLANELEQLIKP